jgi:hypothetical protein
MNGEKKNTFEADDIQCAMLLANPSQGTQHQYMQCM